MNFTEKDLNELQQKGITKERIAAQLETFKAGIPFVELDRAAVVSDGILKFTSKEEQELAQQYDISKKGKSILKFVPASGAASRMFKALFNFLDSFDPQAESYSQYLERTKDKAMKAFFEGAEKFPFHRIVMAAIGAEHLDEDQPKYDYVHYMLAEDGLNFGFLPKGLLPFHDYGDHTATPFEEHLKEGALYASDGGEAQLHFTISEQHGELFNAEFDAVGKRVSLDTKTSFSVGYSFQKASTDTVAVDMDNQLFRNADDSLLYRPGGHGALIENLAEQDADIIFIKNIDNVVVPKYAEDVAHSKKVLGGLLLKVQGKAFAYAEQLEESLPTQEEMEMILAFLQTQLNVVLPKGYADLDLEAQRKLALENLNRPIRICGMVKNEGEPGGGPFWIHDNHGHVSLQIVESAQVDTDNEIQMTIFKESTHFNPVDLVCGTKNHKGEKYDLLQFVDAKQGFITEKTQEGKTLKALELPGLWNGAMAFWNTIFVEVPLVTFNPVKTVNDLLKPIHQVR